MNSWLLLIKIALGAVFLFFLFKKLTPGGSLTAILIAAAIFVGTGYRGVVLLACFFVVGVLATAFKRKTKEALKMAEPREGRRKAGQVWANGGAAALLGLIAWVLPEQQRLFLLLTACAASSATADTVSSEVGIVVGRRTFNILTFRKDRRGENGVVSMEGTVAGIGGSFWIALIYSLLSSWSLSNMLIIVIAGTAGNVADSMLGATLERKGWLGNNSVNFSNTVVGVVVGFGLYKWLH